MSSEYGQSSCIGWGATDNRREMSMLHREAASEGSLAETEQDTLCRRYRTLYVEWQMLQRKRTLNQAQSQRLANLDKLLMPFCMEEVGCREVKLFVTYSCELDALLKKRRGLSATQAAREQDLVNRLLPSAREALVMYGIDPDNVIADLVE